MKTVKITSISAAAAKQPLVMVEWLDSSYRPGWDRGEPETDRPIHKSVGWIVAKTKDTIVLCAHITDEDEPQRCGDMSIPRRCILRTIRI